MHKRILFSYFKKDISMDEDKKWMLMTYYCPTHGDLGVVKPIEMTKKEISEIFLRNERTSKN